MTIEPVAPPTIGTEDWGDDLNAYLAYLEERIEENRVAANTHIIMVPYQYSNSATPASGKINVNWAMGATALNVNDLAADGSALPYTAIDSNQTNRFQVSNSDRTMLIKGDITGVAVDNGGYRTWPITVTELVGTTPSNNTPLTFYVSVYVEL